MLGDFYHLKPRTDLRSGQAPARISRNPGSSGIANAKAAFFHVTYQHAAQPHAYDATQMAYTSLGLPGYDMLGNRGYIPTNVPSSLPVPPAYVQQSIGVRGFGTVAGQMFMQPLYNPYAAPAKKGK